MTKHTVILAPISDLRSALECLKLHPGQLLETDHPVDPNAELAGVYKLVGAGGDVEKPTRIGPAMIFNNVTGYPGSRVLVGMVASRERVAILFGTTARGLTKCMFDAYNKSIPPVNVGPEEAKCQEVVYRATDPGFDVRKILPAPARSPSMTWVVEPSTSPYSKCVTAPSKCSPPQEIPNSVAMTLTVCSPNSSRRN